MGVPDPIKYKRYEIIFEIDFLEMNLLYKMNLKALLVIIILRISDIKMFYILKSNNFEHTCLNFPFDCSFAFIKKCVTHSKWKENHKPIWGFKPPGAPPLEIKKKQIYINVIYETLILIGLSIFLVLLNTNHLE